MNKPATPAQPRTAGDYAWLLFCSYFVLVALASSLLAARHRIFDAAQAGDIGAQFVCMSRRDTCCNLGKRAIETCSERLEIPIQGPQHGVGSQQH